MKKTLSSLIFAGAVLGSTLFVNDHNKEIVEHKLNSPNYYSHFIKYEGKRYEVYDPNPNDGKDEPTIGVGHYLDRPDSEESFRKALPGVDYKSVYNKKRKLTEEEVKKLFEHDIEKYVAETKRNFEDFDSYPNYLKIALVDGFYRGDLAKSPKTKALIREGKFYEASIEYLNHREYRNAKKYKMGGVYERMNKNSRAMLRYSQERKK